MKRAVIPALAVLLASGLVHATPPDLPECVRHIAFAGITPTDGAGNPTGTPDPTDWGCIGGTTAEAPRARASVPPVPPPTHFCTEPAFPNPASAVSAITFTVPYSARVTLIIYSQHGKRGRAFPVRTLLDGAFAAGVHRVLWDLKDDDGIRVAPDVYRAVLSAEDGYSCGDIEVRP